MSWEAVEPAPPFTLCGGEVLLMSPKFWAWLAKYRPQADKVLRANHVTRTRVVIPAGSVRHMLIFERLSLAAVAGNTDFDPSIDVWQIDCACMLLDFHPNKIPRYT
jgi:hypothetical protein